MEGVESTNLILKKLGENHKKTPSQIALKWILQHRCIPLPGSKNPNHIQENFDVMDFILSEKEMEEINEKARLGKREGVTLEKGVGFTDEFDFSYKQCWPKRLF